MKNYYLVRARFGHVGRNYYIAKTVAVYAENGKEAAAYVRNMPRVKHHDKYAIEEVREVTLEEFIENKKMERKDPYFKVSNRQEQNVLCKGLEALLMPMPVAEKHNPKKRKERVKHKQHKYQEMILDAEKYIRNYELEY